MHSFASVHFFARKICDAPKIFVHKQSKKPIRNDKILKTNICIASVSRMRGSPKTEKLMALDTPPSFRPPDQEFCDEFNAAMQATGMNRNELIVRAIRAGLSLVVMDAIEQRRAAEDQFLKRHGAAKSKKASPEA